MSAAPAAHSGGTPSRGAVPTAYRWRFGPGIEPASRTNALTAARWFARTTCGSPFSPAPEVEKQLFYGTITERGAGAKKSDANAALPAVDACGKVSTPPELGASGVSKPQGPFLSYYKTCAAVPQQREWRPEGGGVNGESAAAELVKAFPEEQEVDGSTAQLWTSLVESMVNSANDCLAHETVPGRGSAAQPHSLDGIPPVLSRRDDAAERHSTSAEPLPATALMATAAEDSVAAVPLATAEAGSAASGRRGRSRRLVGGPKDSGNLRHYHEGKVSPLSQHHESDSDFYFTDYVQSKYWSDSACQMVVNLLHEANAKHAPLASGGAVGVGLGRNPPPKALDGESFSAAGIVSPSGDETLSGDPHQVQWLDVINLLAKLYLENDDNSSGSDSLSGGGTVPDRQMDVLFTDAISRILCGATVPAASPTAAAPTLAPCAAEPRDCGPDKLKSPSLLSLSASTVEADASPAVARGFDRTASACRQRLLPRSLAVGPQPRCFRYKEKLSQLGFSRKAPLVHPFVDGGRTGLGDSVKQNSSSFCRAGVNETAGRHDGDGIDQFSLQKNPRLHSASNDGSSPLSTDSGRGSNSRCTFSISALKSSETEPGDSHFFEKPSRFGRRSSDAQRNVEPIDAAPPVPSSDNCAMLAALASQIPLNSNGELSSIGSIAPHLGACKPCVFFKPNRNQCRCSNGVNCQFCHLPHDPPKRPPRPSKRHRTIQKALLLLEQEREGYPQITMTNPEIREFLKTKFESIKPPALQEISSIVLHILEKQRYGPRIERANLPRNVQTANLANHSALGAREDIARSKSDRSGS